MSTPTTPKHQTFVAIAAGALTGLADPDARRHLVEDAEQLGNAFVQFVRDEDGDLHVRCLDPTIVVLLAQCRECGCTDNSACFPTCHWVEPDLCSECALGADQ